MTFHIPAGAFENQWGDLVMGQVHVEIIELSKKSDILLADRTTTSGNQLLETGGAFYFGDWVDESDSVGTSQDHMAFGDCPHDVSQTQGGLRNHCVLYREAVNGVNPDAATSTGSNGWANTYDQETQAGQFG